MLQLGTRESWRVGIELGARFTRLYLHGDGKGDQYRGCIGWDLKIVATFSKVNEIHF